jgi:flagellar hook-basal body complex protein FliE
MSPLSAIHTSMPGLASPLEAYAPDVMPLKPSEVAPPTPISSTQPAGDSFASMLGKMVTDASAEQNNALQSVRAVQGGQNVPLHQAVIGMEEANVSFQLMVEVRNRLLDAYQEVMRMQI